ncbi:MAG: hypothetical protein LLG37_07590, partial [Spirochaetia bacterium]|nr:hypothetical protein [Spirochaetia bacterium]
LFALVFVERFFAYAREQYGKQVMLNVTIAAAAVFTLIAWENHDIYFRQWAKNPGAWAEFSTDEYAMGKYVHSLGDDWVAVVRPDWVESYTFRFATYPYDNFRHFNLSEWVPIREKEKKNYVYILDSSYLPILSILKNMYPEGKYGEFRHKYIPGNLLFFTYEVPYEAVKRYQDKPSLNGLTGRYYRGIDWSGNPVITRIDPFILFNWTIDPVMGKYSVKWTGRIKIDRPGKYYFSTDSNDYSDVAIDGKTVVINPGREKGGPKSKGEVTLSRGMHDLQVRYYESIHYSRMQFWWQPPYAESQEVVPSEVLFPK